MHVWYQVPFQGFSQFWKRKKKNDAEEHIAVVMNKCKVTTFERIGLTWTFYVRVICNFNNFLIKMEQCLLCCIVSVKSILCCAKHKAQIEDFCGRIYGDQPIKVETTCAYLQLFLVEILCISLTTYEARRIRYEICSLLSVL